MSKKPQPVRIEQDPEKPVAKRILAQQVVRLGRAASELLGSGLDREDLVSLIERRAGVGRPDIRAVLDAVEALGKRYSKA